MKALGLMMLSFCCCSSAVLVLTYTCQLLISLIQASRQSLLQVRDRYLDSSTKQSSIGQPGRGRSHRLGYSVHLCKAPAQGCGPSWLCIRIAGSGGERRFSSWLPVVRFRSAGGWAIGKMVMPTGQPVLTITSTQSRPARCQPAGVMVVSRSGTGHTWDVG